MIFRGLSADGERKGWKEDKNGKRCSVKETEKVLQMVAWIMLKQERETSSYMGDILFIEQVIMELVS